jgi:hypothetical protein
VSSARDIELLEADARYYRDRVAVLRAKLYRWGEGSTPQLRELERRLTGAEERLRAMRLRQSSWAGAPDAGVRHVPILPRARPINPEVGRPSPPRAV